MSILTKSATSEFQFGAGDGVTKIFPLVANASGFSGEPSIFRKDWQDDQLLYATPRTNLLTYSAQFDNAAWSKTNATVTANAATAPDGTQTADKLVNNTVTNQHSVAKVYTPTSGGQQLTSSVYVQAGEYTRVGLSSYNSTDGSPINALFDLTTGQVVAGTGTITPVGNGWYRCSATGYFTTGTAFDIRAQPASATTARQSIAGDGTSGVYIWGAQLETGSVVTPYIATANTPATVTDYIIDDAAEVVFAQPPLRGAILSWLGSFNYTPLPDPAPSFASTTIISQYANSPIICQLIENMGRYIDPTADIDSLYNLVWNVDTAQGFGLDFWGKVVNVSRQLNIPGGISDFGFKEQTGAQPFGQAPLYLTAPKSTVYALSDNAYRVLILAKALANISDCTAPSLNQLLQNMFKGRGRCYVADLGAMQLQYTFEFPLQPYEVAIITQSGALPRPAAVSAKLLQIDVATSFGFSESGIGPIQLIGSPSFFVNDWMGSYQLSTTPRTNLLTYSAQFDNTAWTKTQASIAANVAPAPDGTTTGDKLIESVGGSYHYAYQQHPLQSGSTYTFSAYVKAAERTQALIELQGAPDGYAYFDLGAGRVINSTNCIASITPIQNGYYRASVTITATATATANCIIVCANGGSSNYAGDGVSGIYIWGAQLETGTQATSYIPTTIAAVTVTDVSSVDLINNTVTFGVAPANNGALSWTGSYNDIARQQQVNVAQQPLGIGDGKKTVFPICGIPGSNSLQPFGQGTLFNSDTGLLNATV